jgi:hypothetical protein
MGLKVIRLYMLVRLYEKFKLDILFIAYVQNCVFLYTCLRSFIGNDCTIILLSFNGLHEHVKNKIYFTHLFHMKPMTMVYSSKQGQDE